VGHDPMTDVLLKRGNLDKGHKQKECHVKMTVMQQKPRKYKDASKPSETRRETCLLHSLQRNQPCRHFDLGFLQNCETTNFHCLSHSLCGSLLQQAQETNTNAFLPFRVGFLKWRLCLSFFSLLPK
jgi:hypothetical protein